MTRMPQIGRLEVADVRSAWAHEARHFTPWLCENLDRLGEALGFGLVPGGSEVAVEAFHADILARNAVDDSLVLIENQLEGSDHTHLGQILTYLAGLEARTVVWVATEFREPHLSAIRWLNEHTDEQFAFFAVQVKVVRIGDSALAPLFDVLERPNTWERRLHTVSSSRQELSELGRQRHAFWSAFVDRVPGEAQRSGPPQRSSNRWRVLPDLDMNISLYLSRKEVGLFVRGPRGGDSQGTREALMLHEPALAARLGTPLGTHPEWFFIASRQGDFTDPAQWPELIEWLSSRADLYEQTLVEIIGGAT